MSALICIATLCSSAAAKETLVKNVAEFDAAVKAAQPGDEIVMADGEWRDVDLAFLGEGTGDERIILRAQTPGKVLLTGTSRLRIGGVCLTARDLLWRDSSAKEDVVSFRFDSKNLAKHCALEDCAIIGDMPDKERKFVSIYGDENEVIGCRFEGKRSKGTLLVVWLGEDAPINAHLIFNNFFGPRERLGENGGEIIRIGDSKTSLQDSLTFVKNNYFYRCDGEAEIISNKSSKNQYYFNVFVGCSGALTLRHGNKAEVLGNQFYGDGRKGTGGVRIIGERHVVSGNYFYELTGDDTRAAISVMNGIAHSPLNGYFPVQDVEISLNSFIRCNESFVIGNADDDQPKQTVPPSRLAILENYVDTEDRPVFIVRTPGDQTCEGNKYFGGPLGLKDETGWTEEPKPPKDGLSLIRECPKKLAKTGPEWMKPGEEFLPEVAKKLKAKEPKLENMSAK